MNGLYQQNFEEMPFLPLSSGFPYDFPIHAALLFAKTTCNILKMGGYRATNTRPETYEEFSFNFDFYEGGSGSVMPLPLSKTELA